MERDGMSQKDAEELYNSVFATIQDLLDSPDCSLSEIEDIISSELGLEPDYLDDFLV